MAYADGVFRKADLQGVIDLAIERNMDPSDLLRMMTRSFSRGPTIHGLLDTFRFGKYSGETVEVVIRGDPRYMKWLVETSEWFELDTEALELLEEFVLDVRPHSKSETHCAD